ncbi:uncharacterized protein LOC128501775 [Spea bombifrons]|uniref:uncharacterized protein LOC128501775 n=1 Tax=Spea bombifrons TaxID=233779 RepID=UPI00234B05A9|nr:uncharacterized protein LOC128501775 [Spea bombifrons]
MEPRRFRGESEIDRTFDAVYRSLIGNGDHSGNGLWHKGKCCTGFSQSSHCLSFHKSRITSTKITQEKITLTLSDNACITDEKLPEAENTTLADCKLKMKTRYVHEKLNQGANDTIFQQDFVNQSNLDSGFQDLLETSNRRQEQNSPIYTPGENTCNTSVTTFLEDDGKQQLLCKACQNLQNKVRKYKSAGVKVFKIFDPNHWCCDYWMLNRIRHKDNTDRLKSIRNLKKTLKTLIALRLDHLKRTEQASLKCIRPHSFLQRNLRLCKRTHHRHCNSKPQRKSKSRLRSKGKTDKNGVEQNAKAKKHYFLGDSSSQEEDDYDLHRHVKVHKGKGRDGNQKLVNQGNTTRSLAGTQFLETTSTRKNWLLRSEVSSQKNIVPIFSLDVDESGVDSDDSFHIEPIPNATGVIENDPTLFSWGNESFRDMLAELNSGRLCSTIVKED